MHRIGTITLSLAILAGLTPSVAAADQIVVPVAIYARGAGLTSWSTEVRVRNSTADTVSFRVVDYVGNSAYGFNPATYPVAPGKTASYGAWALHGTANFCGGFPGV